MILMDILIVILAIWALLGTIIMVAITIEHFNFERECSDWWRKITRNESK